jgi:hypothetical protein
MPTDTLNSHTCLMVDRLSLVHVHRDSFQTAIEQQIPQLTAFVKEHDILDLDPSKPWNLRVVCNTILDYSIHVKGMTQQQGLDLLMNQAFQQEAEAQGKWRRATLSQVQLCSYFTGFREIMLLREEVRQQKGADFSLKAFHEEFLSFGSAPVKYVRELMLGKQELAS